MRILLIEDNPADVEFAQLAWEAAGVNAEFTVMRDGEQATRHFDAIARGTAARPDLVLLDLNLPRIPGHEVLARIAGDEQLASLPVVVLTTSDAQQDRERCFALGADVYLLKPFDFSSFITLVEQVDTWMRGDGPAPGLRPTPRFRQREPWWPLRWIASPG